MITWQVRVRACKPLCTAHTDEDAVSRRGSLADVDSMWCGRGSHCQATTYLPTSRYRSVQSPTRIQGPHRASTASHVNAQRAVAQNALQGQAGQATDSICGSIVG
jgi:hypothetical protein